MVFWTRGTASLPLILLLVLYPKPTSPLSVDGRKSSQKSTSHRPKTRIPPALLHDDRLPSRRKVLKHAVSIVGALSSSLLWNYPGWAADPLTLGEVEGLGARAERALRGKPPKALRPPLDQDFAVLLMRSSYMALDAIDCVAMDQFQRDFFLLRQSEYQPYIDQVGPGIVQQGFLTDPYYFDFISFAQYATISREINQNPPSVFVERQPSPTDDTDDSPTEFIDVVVKRNPTLTNDRLAPQHGRLVGGAILDKLIENVGSTDIAIPAIKPGDNGKCSDLRHWVLGFLGQVTEPLATHCFGQVRCWLL